MQTMGKSAERQGPIRLVYHRMLPFAGNRTHGETHVALHDELIKSAVFGLVEGITEWLPISSTGHMLLLDEFVKLDVSDSFWKMFLVVIQLGAILAVCLMFFGKLNPFSPSKDADERRSTWALWGKVILACIPASVIGIPLDDWMDEHLGSPLIIAGALIAYGVIFIVLETWRNRRALEAAPAAGRHFAGTDTEGTSGADALATTRDIDQLGWGTALGIGMFQVLSLVPGTSRSGSTIIGGLLLGCSRPVAAEFTFFLAIPVMFGASALRLAKYFLEGATLTGDEGLILAVGCLSAFITSLIIIRLLMGFVRKHDFRIFGWYRIILGIAVIAYFAFLRA